MAGTNLFIVFRKIDASSLTAEQKRVVKTEASKNAGIAEGIALQDPCDDEFLKRFLPTGEFIVFSIILIKILALLFLAFYSLLFILKYYTVYFHLFTRHIPRRQIHVLSVSF